MEFFDIAADTPRISIGMPVYNGEVHIREAVSSILQQTFANFELIISDNASDDKTGEICEQLAAHDQRIRYFSNARNVGASDNYNFVFRKSRGGYFKWASSNDLCHPTLVEKCIEVLDEDKSAVAAFTETALFVDNLEDATPYDEDLAIESDDPVERFTTLLDRIQLNNLMNGVIRTSVLGKTPLIKPYFASDTCLMAELALHGKIRQVPECLFYRRMDALSATKLRTEEEIVRHWNPDSRPVLFSNTKAIIQYYGAAIRATLSAGQRLRYIATIFRRTVWARQTIWREVVESLSFYVRPKKA